MGLVDLFMGRTVSEERDTSSYTDTLVALLVARAGGSVAKATATAALESCAGLVSRAFAAADVVGPEVVRRAFDTRTRALCGRALIRGGEAVLVASSATGDLRFIPAASWDIAGSFDPRSWRYSVELGGPSGGTRRMYREADVIHLQYSTDPERPWHGVGPIESASMAGRLSAELVNALGDEASGTRGYLLPIPKDGEDSTIKALKEDLKTLGGGLAMVESQSAGQWTEQTPRTSTAGGWTPQRIGAAPPESLVRLCESATREVLAAVGIPPQLFGFGSADSAALREAWRITLHGVISPLGDQVTEELSEKTGQAVSLSWNRLRASDVTGNARAFGSLIEAGATFDSAAGAVGLDLIKGETNGADGTASDNRPS